MISWSTVLLVLALVASSNGSWALDCVGVRNQLRRKGFDTDVAAANHHQDSKQAVCASPNKCCTPDVEAALLQWAQKDLSVAALSATQPLDQLLETTLADASERMAALLNRSAHDTRMLMQQVYPSLAAQPDAQQAITQLYRSLDRYLLTSSDSNLRIKHLRVDVRETVARFFADLFSPAFLCVTMGEPCRAVTTNYSTCLINNAAEFEPFGEEPKRLAKLLASYIGEYRAVIASFRALQAHIADIKTSLLPGRRHNEHCIRNVARLKMCPLCSSTTERAGFCPDYCIDVLQSCLYSDEWQEKWDSALMLLKDLVFPRRQSTTREAENVLTEFGRSVQLAVTNIVETRAPVVAKSVVERCGSLPHLQQKSSTQSPGTTKRTIARTRSEPNDSKGVTESLRAGIQNLTNYIGWWRRLTTSLCRSADERERCWNGTSVGRYVKASLPTASPAAAPSTSAYPDHETMVARMTKINEILDEARFGKSRPGRRYGTETMLMRPEEEGTGEGLLQGEYNNGHHQWGVDDEDMTDGSGSGAASEHDDVAEYADIGAPVWPDEPVQSKPPAKEKPLWTASETHPEDQTPAAKSASQRRWWSAFAFALFVFAFVRW